MTYGRQAIYEWHGDGSLNAPFGARCFMTQVGPPYRSHILDWS